MLNKQGMPKFSMDYLRQIIPDEHFQNLGYLSVITFMGGMSFVVYSPLVLFAYLIVSEVGIKYQNAPLVSTFKEYLQKGVNGRAHFMALRADLEVYIGVYLIVGWFLGWSSLISIFFYWQYMRLKYMLNYNTKLAFTKFATTIDGYVNRPAVPGLLKTGWTKAKDLCAYMARVDQPQEGGNAPSMCTIF